MPFDYALSGLNDMWWTPIRRALPYAIDVGLSALVNIDLSKPSPFHTASKGEGSRAAAATLVYQLPSPLERGRG
ncbi:MAG: hypothetical protein LBL94_00995 [Prevotellaceae bacterium]|nr:hypothetical protein [Prevotellaceae bacterium]